MTPDKKRAILEAAAKACGIEGRYNGITEVIYLADGFGGERRWWNPIDNSSDTTNMCARLDINTIWHFDKIVECADKWCSIYHAAPHDGTDEGKESAWRLAASMVAAKVGGYTE